jgi:hypothetical protein
MLGHGASSFPSADARILRPPPRPFSNRIEPVAAGTVNSRGTWAGIFVV